MLRSTRHFFVRYWIPLLVYASLVLFLSTRQSSGLPSFDIPDKVMHFIEYTAFGMLLFRLLSRDYHLKGPLLWCLHILVLAAFAFCDELLQGFIPTRETDPLDGLADMAGGVMGAIAYLFIRFTWDEIRICQTGKTSSKKSQASPLNLNSSQKGTDS